MKKISAIILFFCCNSIFIFFEVHKQAKYLTLSYEVQRLNHELHKLKKEQTHLIYELSRLQQPHNIADYAEKNLGMKKIEHKKIKKAVKDIHEA